MFRIPLPDPNANPIGDALKYVAALQQKRAQQQVQQQQLALQQQANERANQLAPYQIESAKADAAIARNKVKSDEDFKKYMGFPSTQSTDINSSTSTQPNTNQQIDLSNQGNQNQTNPDQTNNMPQTQGIPTPINQNAPVNDQTALANNQASTTNNQPKSLRESLPPEKRYAYDSYFASSKGLAQPKIVDVDGQQTVISPFGAPYVIAKGQTPLQKAETAETAKQVGKWSEELGSNLDIKDKSDLLRNVVESPGFESIKQHPGFMGNDIYYYETNGTPEQKESIGKFYGYAGDLYSSFAARMKGSLTGTKVGIISSVKPDKKDSIQVIIGKIKAMETLAELKNRRLQLQTKLVNENGLDTSVAQIAARKLLKSDEIESQIEKEFKPKVSNSVIIQAPNGQKFNIDSNKVDAFLAENPDHKRVQ